MRVNISRFEFLCSFSTAHVWVKLQGSGGLLGGGCAHVDHTSEGFPALLHSLLVSAQQEHFREPRGVLRVECSRTQEEPLDIRETLCNCVMGVRAVLSDGQFLEMTEEVITNGDD